MQETRCSASRLSFLFGLSSKKQKAIILCISSSRPLPAPHWPSRPKTKTDAKTPRDRAIRHTSLFCVSRLVVLRVFFFQSILSLFFIYILFPTIRAATAVRASRPVPLSAFCSAVLFAPPTPDSHASDALPTRGLPVPDLYVQGVAYHTRRAQAAAIAARGCFGCGAGPPRRGPAPADRRPRVRRTHARARPPPGRVCRVSGAHRAGAGGHDAARRRRGCVHWHRSIQWPVGRGDNLVRQGILGTLHHRHAAAGAARLPLASRPRFAQARMSRVPALQNRAVRACCPRLLARRGLRHLGHRHRRHAHRALPVMHSKQPHGTQPAERMGLYEPQGVEAQEWFYASPACRLDRAAQRHARRSARAHARLDARLPAAATLIAVRRARSAQRRPISAVPRDRRSHVLDWLPV